jgi:lycopene cyclase domain-containing protein
MGATVLFQRGIPKFRQMNLLYMYINLGAFSIPLIFSFHPQIQFYKKWKFIFPAILFTSIVFIIWDIYFTDMKIWGFNSSYIIGKYFYQLPLEEVLFFVAIPYASLFTYHCFSILVNKQIFKMYEQSITVFLIGFSTFISILFHNRLYTISTFTSLFILLVSLKYVFKVKWLNRFYFTFLVILIPFTIVNGILTGTGIDQPIVWYNNHENIGFRILSIPLEDVFYGMLLLLLNTSLYEYFSRNK